METRTHTNTHWQMADDERRAHIQCIARTLAERVCMCNRFDLQRHTRHTDTITVVEIQALCVVWNWSSESHPSSKVGTVRLAFGFGFWRMIFWLVGLEFRQFKFIFLTICCVSDFLFRYIKAHGSRITSTHHGWTTLVLQRIRVNSRMCELIFRSLHRIKICDFKSR